MKQIIFIVLTVLILTVANSYAKGCKSRLGRANVAWGLVYKFIDNDCDGSWDKVKEVKFTSNGWTYTGKQWDCPEKFKTLKLLEIKKLPNL